MNDQEIADLQELNAAIAALKRELRDLLQAPVVDSIYDDKVQAMSEDFVLLASEIDTVFPEVVQSLTRATRERGRMLGKGEFL
ncbi:MAG: hypothetical protein AAF329_16615 [Cyanobacteria bacterium P01_A01_bin.17]